MNALIARMREKHCTAISIEVSAQALTQMRVDGLFFDAVGFTNLSHDHLDDYADLDEYLAAKAELFVPERATTGVVSLDSEYGAKFAAASKIPVVTITSKAEVKADWRVEITAEVASKTAFKLTGPQGQTLESWVPILGAHMAANAGLAVVMMIQAGYEFDRISRAVKGGIDAYLPGRTELVSGQRGPSVYVDFGHSPDAFLNTLAAVRKVTAGRVLMLFGADGDRDATKRADMARIAAEGSDILVITDHHPRFEDPASIRKTLFDAAKLARPDMPLFEVSPPEAAIRKAVSLVGEGDSILWAGPGHQDYRDIRGVRTPYSARQEARDALKEAGWS
jgi:UDP-N-acetylmuramoyl-L-alanyl-D-glutamate--2,6-diaminopimelate ligase